MREIEESGVMKKNLEKLEQGEAGSANYKATSTYLRAGVWWAKTRETRPGSLGRVGCRW